MIKRFNVGQVRITDFSDYLLAICPQCKEVAHVKGRVTCLSCGLNKDSERVYIYPSNLWLSTHCCGHILWAHNPEHLAWIKSYVSAGLRERTKENFWHNQSLASRLPKWLKTAKNRRAVLKAISRLERLVPINLSTPSMAGKC